MGAIDDGVMSAQMRRVADKLQDGLEYAVRHGMSFSVRIEGFLPVSEHHEAIHFEKTQESASSLQKTLAKVTNKEGMLEFIDGIQKEMRDGL